MIGRRLAMLSEVTCASPAYLARMVCRHARGSRRTSRRRLHVIGYWRRVALEFTVAGALSNYVLPPPSLWQQRNPTWRRAAWTWPHTGAALPHCRRSRRRLTHRDSAQHRPSSTPYRFFTHIDGNSRFAFECSSIGWRANSRNIGGLDHGSTVNPSDDWPLSSKWAGAHREKSDALQSALRAHQRARPVAM